MCGLCGLLGGGDDWTAASAHPQVFGEGRTRRAERAERVRMANRVLSAFALRLDDWQGASFVLASATGKREIVDTLPDVWRAAAGMLGRPIDPLDRGLVERIAGASP
jgi:hypothetical protein